MGDIYNIACGSCSHEYKIHAGCGMRSFALFCEACGKPTSVEHGGFNALRSEAKALPRCRCGGKLSSDIQPACPKCGSRLMKKLVSCGMWD